jgi:phenylalanyl-tRNA synthetase beta subunit
MAKPPGHSATTSQALESLSPRPFPSQRGSGGTVSSSVYRFCRGADPNAVSIACDYSTAGIRGRQGQYLWMSHAIASPSAGTVCANPCLVF